MNVQNVKSIAARLVATSLWFVAADAFARQCPNEPPPPPPAPPAGDGGSNGGATGGGGGDNPTSGGGGGGPSTGGGPGVNSPGPTTGGGGGPGPTTGGGGSPPADSGGGGKGPTTGGKGSKGTGVKTGPGGPAGPSTPSGPGAGGSGPTTGGGRPAGPGTGSSGPRGVLGGAITGKKGRTTVSLDRWDLWWDLNREAFLVSRAPSAGEVTRNRGFLEGYGARVAPPIGTRPTLDFVGLEIVPALREALKDSDPAIRAAAATALGRIAPKELASECVTTLHSALSSSDTSVREAAIVAIGQIGDRAAVKTLWQVMNDTTEARAQLGQSGGVQSRERSFAALALGLTDGRDAAEQFRRLIGRNGIEVELRGCAVLALGMLGADAADQVPFLGEMLCDKELDRRVRSQVPVALARIGEPALPLMPYLLQFAGDVHEDALVRESCVIGLGKLAASFDAEVLVELRTLARDDKDNGVRHYALISLAQIAARSQDPLLEAETSGVARFLAQQLDRPRNKIDEPWAALACGILGGAMEHGSDGRVLLEETLVTGFRGTGNPQVEGAYAIAIGLAGVRGAGDALVDRFTRSGDADVRRHLAMGLGLIGHRAAASHLRDAMSETNDSDLRVDAARALALLHETGSSAALLDRLENHASSAEARSIACAAAWLRDPASGQRLVAIARERTLDPAVRAAACEALGVYAERTEIPYTAELTGDLNVHAGLQAPAELISRL